MSQRTLIAIIAVAVLAVVAVISSEVWPSIGRSSATRQPSAPAQSRAAVKYAAPLVAEPVIRPRFRVAPRHDVPAHERETQLELAAQLSKLTGVPEHRRRHFAWIANEDLFLHGYSASIEQVITAPEGMQVALIVYPDITAGRHRGGTSATSFDHIREWYELRDGKWRYLRGEEVPAGIRGYLTD